jgi:hypothetical protein
MAQCQRHEQEHERRFACCTECEVAHAEHGHGRWRHALGGRRLPPPLARDRPAVHSAKQWRLRLVRDAAEGRRRRTRGRRGRAQRREHGGVPASPPRAPLPPRQQQRHRIGSCPPTSVMSGMGYITILCNSSYYRSIWLDVLLIVSIICTVVYTSAGNEPLLSRPMDSLLPVARHVGPRLTPQGTAASDAPLCCCCAITRP